MAGGRIDPLGGNSFHLELDGENAATFKEVEGVESETDVVELVQAGPGGKQVWIKSQGAWTQKMGKITAKYAAFEGDKLLDWRQKVIDGKMEDARKNISIVLYNVEDEEVMRFNFKNAWPSKYSWSGMNASGNDPVTVTIIIEHEGMEFPD